MIISAPAFKTMLLETGMDDWEPKLFVDSLEANNIKYGLATSAIEFIQENVDKVVDGKPYVAVYMERDDDTMLGPSLIAQGTTCICIIIYIESFPKLMDVLKRTKKMKAFI